MSPKMSELPKTNSEWHPREQIKSHTTKISEMVAVTQQINNSLAELRQI